MSLFDDYVGTGTKLYTTRPDGTPNSYAESMRNISENDPNAARKLKLDIANERNKKLLQGTQPQTKIDVENWKANGFDNATIDQQLRKEQLLQDMPIDERLANIERMKAGDPYAIDDWQFAQALENGNLPYLINEYGEEAANYAIQRFHQKNQNINTITRDKQSEDLLSWKTAENMGTAVLRKGVDTVNSVVNGVDLLVNGQDAVERIANREGLLDKTSDFLHDSMSDGYHHAEERLQAKDNLRDQLQWENELGLRNQGYLKEKAQQQAKNDRQWQQISDMNDATLLAPQAAELTADLLIGGGVAKGANLVGKGIVKSAGKLAEKKAIKNIDNAIASKVASKIEPKLQAKYSGEKTASQLAQARLAGEKVNNTLGNASVHKVTGKATIINQGEEAIHKGTLLGSTIKTEAKNTANQVGNAIEKSRDSVIKYQSAQIAQKLKDKVTPKVLGSIRKDIDDLATTAGKVTATAGVIAHGANQEAIEAIGSTYNQMMSIEPDKLYRTVKGKHMIDSLVQEKGFNSYEEAKKDGSFMEEFYKRQSQLAKETSISAYKEVFKDSAIVNALTSRAELAVGGVTNKVKGFKKYLGDTAFKQLGEITEEFVESYSGEYRPKDEINKAVGSKVYDPEKQAFALGVHGAIVAGLGTGGINTLPLGAKGVQKATKVVSNKIDSIGKKSQENASDNNLKSIVTGIDVTSTEPSNIKDKAINKVKNTFGIASQIDEETQKNLDKEFAKTETGKVAQKLDESLSNIEDENVKKYFAENTSLSHRINFLNDQFERNTKEISKLQSNQNLSEEQSKRLSHLTAYNNSIRSTLQEFQTAIDKDIDSIDHKILEEYKIKEEAFVDFQDKVDRGEITREDANIQIKAMQEAYNKHADAYTKQIDKLIQSDLYQSIYKTEFEDSVDTNTEPSQFISAKELTDLHNNNLGSASINVQKKFEEGIAKIESNNKLTATQKRQAKRKLAMGMVKAVRQIGTNSDTTLANVKEHWNNLGSVVDGIISSLNSKDYGLEPNNANTIVHLLSHIKQLADNSKNMSDKEALTLMGKYIGTKHGGYKNKGNIGLLAYAQRALDNNGKFLPEDKLRLAHFFNTQEQKLLSLKSLELEMLNSGNLDENGSVISGSFNLKNHVLKTGDNTKQQDRENDVEFTSLGELRSYMSKVSKDQEDFSKFANKYLNVSLKPTVKLSGSKATKNAKTTKPKKVKKSKKAPSHVATSSIAPVAINTVVPLSTSYTTVAQDNNSNLVIPENLVVVEEGSFADAILAVNSENTVKDEANDDIDAALDSFLNDGSASWSPNVAVPAKDAEVQEFVNNFRANVQLPKGFEFTQDQWRALHFLNKNLEIGDSFTSVISGYAGTGKSTMIDYLFKYRKNMGLNKSAPIYVTPTHAAGVVISTKTKSIYTTVKSTINSINVSEYTGKATVEGSLAKAIKINNDNGANINTDTEVFVVDEASMISSIDFEKLVSTIQEYNPNTHIIFMGDYMQLPSPSDKQVTTPKGTKYQLVSRAFRESNIVELKEIKRTSDNDILTVLNSLRNAEGDKLGKLPIISSSNNNLKYAFDGTPERFEIAREALEDFRTNPQGTKWIAYTNSEVTKINNALRQEINGYSKDTILQKDEWVTGYLGYGNKSTMSDTVANSVDYRTKSIEDIKLDKNGFEISEVKFHQKPELIELGIHTDPTAKFIPLSEDDAIKVTTDKAVMNKNMKYLKNYITEGLNKLYKAIKIPKSNNEFRKSEIADAVRSMYDLRDYTFSTSYDFLPVIKDGKVIDVTHKVRTGSSNAFGSTLMKVITNKDADPNLRELYRYILFGIPELEIQDIYSAAKGIDYNFAITIHKSQGMSIDNVYYKATSNKDALSKIIADDNEEIVSTEANSLHYVAMSRSTKKLRVVVDKNTPYYEVSGSNKVNNSPTITIKQELPKPAIQIVNDTNIPNVVYEQPPYDVYENYGYPDIAETIYEIKDDRKYGTSPVITEEDKIKLLEIAKNNPDIAPLLIQTYNLKSKPVDVPVITTKVEISKDFNLNTDKPYSFGYNGKTYASIQEYLNENNISKDDTLNTLKGIYFSWALNDEFVFNQIQNNNNPIEFIGSTDTTKLVANVLNEMHKFIKDNSYGSLREKYKGIVAKFAPIKQTKVSTPNIKIESPVNTPNTPKGVYISNLPMSVITSDNNWASTAEWIKSKYNPKFNDVYRFNGLNLFQNPKTKEITVSNVLQHKDITIVESKKQLGTQIGDSLNKDSIANEFSKYVDENTSQEEQSKEFEYIYRYAGLTDSIAKYLSNLKYTSSVFNLNGILQLMNVTQNGSEVTYSYSSELPKAMTRAFIQTLNRSRLSKGSEVYKEYTTDGVYELQIQDLSRIGEGHEYDANKTFKQSKEELLAGKDFIEPTFDMLGSLGSEKNKFIAELGKDIVKNLGISVKPNSEIEFDMKSLEFAVGVQAFQAMFDMGMLRIVRLAKYENTAVKALNENSNVTFIDHVSFKWDSPDLANVSQITYRNRMQVKSLIRSLGFATTDLNTARELFGNLTEGRKKVNNNTLHGLSQESLALLRLKALSDTKAGKTVFPEKTKYMHGVSDKPFTAKASDIQNKTNTGQNKIALEVVQAQNNIPYVMNSNKEQTGLADFLFSNQDNQETFLSFLGVENQNEDNIDSVNKSNMSIENGYRRELDLAKEQYLSLTDTTLDNFYLKHEMMTNQRVNQTTPLSPKALKVVRELVLPDTKDSNGNSIRYGFDISNLSNYLDLIDEAISLVQDTNYLSKVGTVDVTKDRYVNVTGYALALAQALGIKVENLSEVESLKKLKDLLSNSDISNMVKDISDSLTNNTPLDSVNLRKAKDFGINSPRGFNSLYTLAQINAKKGINSIGLFEPKLVIEADGKGNGVYNNVKQFSTHFSEGYFDNLKRTGNVTLDLITQELASGKSLEEIEGTKLLASKVNKEDILRDVYEAVSDRLVSKLQNAIQYAKANAKFDINTKSLNDVFFTNGRIVDLLKNTPQTVNGEPNPIYDLYSMFYTAKIIAELGGIKDLDFNAPVAQINITEIARSIAKIAVTPSNYGGQIDGITSQLFTDIKKMLKEKSNDFYNKVQNTSPEESEKLTKDYINLLRLLGIEEKIDLSKHSLKDTINWLSTIPNRQETYTLLTNTLGTTMFNAINDVYGEQFATVRAIVNYDNALFFAFFSEYQDAIRNAINIRNIKNKWVDDEGNVLDPKAYNFLNEKELQNVLKSLKNVPNVATAMSGSSKLINELIHSGNSITKEAVIEYNSGKNKNNSQAIFSSKGYNEVWGIMKEEWNSFRPAGASLLVSSIVSTESLTQGRLAQELAKENIYTLDVFDGIEVNPIFRFKVGSSANRITDEIHKEVSLIGSFYEYASRTNLDEFMENLLRDPTLKDMHRFNLNSKNGKVLVNSQLLVGIQSVLSSVNFLSSFKGEDLSNMEKEVKKAESLHRQLLLNLLQQVSTQGKSNEPVEIQLTEYQATSLVNLTKLMLNTHNVIPTALKYYRDMAINAKAMKEVDNEYLPLVVNQFGGINNGYIKMPQKAEATMKRFTKFLNNHPEYGDLPNLKLKSSSKVLDDFVKQDSIIQEAYEKARAKYSKQYPLVTRQSNSAKLNIENVKTVNELSDALTEKFKQLDNTSSETGEYRLDQQVALGVLPMVKDLANFYDKNMKTPLTVTTNRSEYISKLPEQSAKVVSNPNVNGYMHPTVGIFIEPSNLEVNSFTGLHELIHVGMDYLWGYFYMKPEVLKNNPNKVAGLRLIETVAKQFAFSFTNNSEYLKVIDFLHKQSSFNVNNAFAYTVDTVAAMAANINYVFSEEFANKASPLEVAQAKSQAMKEFLAYGLTNLNLMNQLNKLALKNKQQVYEETGFKQAWDSLKQVFNKMFNAFLSIFGYTQHNADRVDNSLLSHSVKALMVISQSNADIANNTDNIGSASINTTSFNNTTHVSTEDAIRSLGQLNGNSQNHIDNMLDIYNSVNQTLEERDYRSYPEAYKDIKDNTFNQEAINDMNTLMQKGLPFTSLDENMFKLMYGVNKANFENNPEYVKEATKILHNLLSNIPAKFRGNIFHEELSKLEPYSLLALVQTNENLKSSIEQYLNQDNSKLQEFRANAVYKGLNTSEMSKPTIDRLSILASKLKFDGKNSLVTQAKQLAQEAKQQSSRVKALDTINDLADDIPIKHIPTAVKFIAEEWFSGENLKHQDTNMEKALANIAKRSALLANRPTVVSKLIRLFLGAMGDTQYIYSMQNKYSILADTAKEKIGNLINASIDASFGKQLSTEEHTTLKRAFFDTGMNFIVNEGNIDIHKVLKDKAYRKDEIRRIANTLYGEYSGIDKNTLESFIQWQTDGLAEMSIKGLAKSKQQGIPSFISPNAKAIANLTLLKSIGEVSNNVNFDRASVESLANTLVALKSLEYVEQSQLNNLSDMFKNYSKGMSLLSKETNNAYNKAYGFYPDNYSGYQNYQHTKKNPNKDYEIVEPSDKDTINRLLELGYENRMALPTGELVFATNQSVASNLVNGILLFTEITVNGANQVTGKKIGDKSLTKNINKPLVQKSFKQLWDNEIKGNKSYYSNLSDLSNYSITLNHDGSIRDVEAKLENKHKQMFTQETEHSYEHVGDLQARQIEELTVQRNNLDAIQKLNQAFKNDKDKSKYILFNGKYKAKGNSQEDIRFAQEFNNLYHMLPAGTRQEIEQMGGLYLNRVELANILGYEQASIVDIYTGKSGLPKAVQNAVKSTMSALVQAKLIKNPVTALKKSERLKTEVTSLAKDIVLNKSVIVPAANLISNIIHLWMSGIPVTDIPKLIVQGYQEVKLYNKYEGEMFLLNHQIQGGRLSVYEKQKAQLKVAQLSKLIDKLSITPLMRSGIYTNISDKEVNSESFGILDDVSKRFGLNKLENNTPEFLKNLLILRNSKAHSLMEESLNYGDFISKYAIYMHLTTKKNVDSNTALDFIRDEFVNYAMNRGREFDWANKVGLTWFLSYKLGIQRVIYRNLRRNFLRTMAVWQASDSLKASGMDLGGLIQTVPQQRLWTDYSGYHFELDNMVDSFGSHWIERLLF